MYVVVLRELLQMLQVYDGVISFLFIHFPAYYGHWFQFITEYLFTSFGTDSVFHPVLQFNIYNLVLLKIIVL